MKLTSKMTKVELAKVWGEHFGLKGNSGGWIYKVDPNATSVDPRLGWAGTPVAHGWVDLADALELAGLIVVGQGINWRASGEKPLIWRNKAERRTVVRGRA